MYPISYEVDFNPTPNRWTTFFRIILAIPWIIVAYFYVLLSVFTHIFAWVSVIVLGRYPQWLYNFNSGVVRYLVRFYAWAYLQTDVWPPFGLADDPSYPIRVNIAPRAERQSRLKALFRLLLALPVMIVLAYGVSYLIVFASIVAWLMIVFRGYLPQGLNETMTFGHSLQARVLGYLFILTDDYPPVGIEKAAGAVATTPPPPPPPPTTA
jgi:Domain of unknown function (DUF4389)